MCFLACFHISQSIVIDEPIDLSYLSVCIINLYQDLTKKRFFWDKKTLTRKIIDKKLKILIALDWKVNVSKEEFTQAYPQYLF